MSRERQVVEGIKLEASKLCDYFEDQSITVDRAEAIMRTIIWAIQESGSEGEKIAQQSLADSTAALY